MMPKMNYLYRCPSEGPQNNNKMPKCNFEMVFPEGPHNCPLCAEELVIVPSGPSVSELLRRGYIEEARKMETQLLKEEKNEQ